MSFSFQDSAKGILLGSSGGIGRAIKDKLLDSHPEINIICPSREEVFSTSFWEDDNLKNIDFFINCIGVLGKDNKPEKSSRSIELDSMHETFKVNTYLNALVMKFLRKSFNSQKYSLFVALSAKVGSIDDNKLGGWYSYRASKAALNMLIKTYAIEMKVSHPKLICLAQHPGTTYTKMTENYLSGVKYRVKEASETASILIKLWETIDPECSGSLLNWDGEKIPW